MTRECYFSIKRFASGWASDHPVQCDPRRSPHGLPQTYSKHKLCCCEGHPEMPPGDARCLTMWDPGSAWTHGPPGDGSHRGPLGASLAVDKQELALKFRRCAPPQRGGTRAGREAFFKNQPPLLSVSALSSRDMPPRLIGALDRPPKSKTDLPAALCQQQ